MNKDRFFTLARNASEFSDSPKFKMGAVAVYKSRVIAVSFNKTKGCPIQEKYNVYRGFEIPFNRYGTHAEMGCISQIMNLDIDFSKVHIYVYRENKNGDLAMAKPCPACEKAMRDLGIKNVDYTCINGKTSITYV